MRGFTILSLLFVLYSCSYIKYLNGLLDEKGGGGSIKYAYLPRSISFTLFTPPPSLPPSPPPFLRTFFSLFPSLNYCSLAGNRKSSMAREASPEASGT